MTPKGMTAEKLRDIAAWLTMYDTLAESYIRVTRNLNSNIRTKDVEEMLAAVRSKDVQKDLRRWADEIDRSTDAR